MLLPTSAATLSSLLLLTSSLPLAQAAPKVPRVKNAKYYGQSAYLNNARKQVQAAKLASAAAAADKLKASSPAFQEKYLFAAASPTLSTSNASDPNATSTFEGSAASQAFSAPYENVWAQLTNDEAASVIEWLHDGSKSGLNLTASENATAWDNTISVVDALYPNKTAVLDYIDGKAEKPPRYAKVSLMNGATEEPTIEVVAVGPLPISNATRLESLAWQMTKGDAKIRNWNADEDLLSSFMFNFSISIQDIVQDLLGVKAVGDDDDSAQIWGIDPVWFQGSEEKPEVIQWMGYWGNLPEDEYPFDATTLLPLGLYLEADTTGRDASKWKEMGIYYDGKYYENKDAFRQAYTSGNFAKIAEEQRNVYNASLYGTDRVGEPFPEDGKARPVVVSPEGNRFNIDQEKQYLSWGPFSAFLSFNRDTGLRLFDIKYNGDRIIYELGLDEAVAHYSGSDPVQSGTAYLDSWYSFGAYAFELVEGYDCPGGAAFLNTTFHVDELSKSHKNSICIFEMPMDYPMQRHSSSNYVAISSNTALIIKSVSTVGNYDYSFSYIFYTDGSIETRVQASGYIQSAFWKHNEDFGYHIAQGLSGSMHDHVLSFKLDADIIGTKNSFAKHALVPTNQTYPWSRGISRPGMKLNRSYVETEDDGAMNYKKGEMLLVVNQDEPNEFGEPRGYRIMPSVGGGHYMTIKDSPNLLNSYAFTKNHLYVLNRKDSEPSCKSAWNNADPGRPLVDFSKFFNGESLNQTDLVIWANLGMSHVPHTGDLPNTVMTTAQSSFMFSPHNYLTSDPSRRSNQMVRIDYNSSNSDIVSRIATFGAKPAPVEKAFNLSVAYPSLETYTGDVAVRKFPYDPANPFGDTEAIV